MLSAEREKMCSWKGQPAIRLPMPRPLATKVVVLRVSLVQSKTLEKEMDSLDRRLVIQHHEA